MNEITTVGVDLAKEVIAVCGADRLGKTVFTRIFRREAFAAWAVASDAPRLQQGTHRADQSPARSAR